MPSYCRVKPHWLAVLTTRSTSPLYRERSTGLCSMSPTWKSSTEVGFFAGSPAGTAHVTQSKGMTGKINRVVRSNTIKFPDGKRWDRLTAPVLQTAGATPRRLRTPGPDTHAIPIIARPSREFKLPHPPGQRERGANG